MKNFYEMQNVGRAKYLVNFHDGEKTHNDGSPFYDVKIFKNKKVKNEFVKNLTLNGYTPKLTSYLPVHPIHYGETKEE